MFVKIAILIIFFIILWNLFVGLKYLLQRDQNPDGLYQKLKWRIIISMSLFIVIIIGFLSGVVPLHTL